MGYRSTKKTCWKCGQQVPHYISTTKHPFNKYRFVKDELKCLHDEESNYTQYYWTKKCIPNYNNPVIISDKRKHRLVPAKHLVYKFNHWEICKGSESIG